MGHSELTLKKVSNDTFRVLLKNLNINSQQYIRNNIKNIILRKYFSGISDLMQIDTKRPFYDLEDFKKLITIKTTGSHIDISFNQNQEDVLRSKYIKPNTSDREVENMDISFKSLFFDKAVIESKKWISSDKTLKQKHNVTKINSMGGNHEKNIR